MHFFIIIMISIDCFFISITVCFLADNESHNFSINRFYCRLKLNGFAKQFPYSAAGALVECCRRMQTEPV